MDRALIDRFKAALKSESPETSVAELLRDRPELPSEIGESRQSGFNTSPVPSSIARLLVDRGAPLSAHAASAFGFTDLLASMLQSDPGRVHEKGGDGCTPLHFARDIATAQLLLDHGALIDAHDEDHDSTPAQWRIGEAPEVTRFLLDLGAKPDIFVAAALGDTDLAAKLLAANPACVAHRTGRLPDFPPNGHNGRRGTILQWTLAFNSYPHQIALRKGHTDIFDLLWLKSDPRTRLLVACVLARRDEAAAIAREHPGIVANLPAEDLELLPRYCWETNTNIEAVRLMLDLGFPIAHTERSHGYSPLHNAAWSGNAELVELLISRDHPTDLIDPCFQATPLGFALYDCLVEKRHPEGNFARVAELLLEAGSPRERSQFPTGDENLDAVLARFLK